MNATRYTIFAAISIALHGFVVSAMPAQKPLSISTERSGSSVNIQFVSASKPEPVKKEKTSKKPEQVKTAKPQPQVQPEPQATPKSVKKPVKKPAPKKLVKKEKATNELAKKPVEKVAPKQPELVKVKQPPKVKPKTTTEKKTEEKVVQATSQQTTQKKATQPEVAQAKSSQPKLLKKPSFTAKPTPIRYPRMAKKRGYEGKVIIEVWIDESGLQTRQIIHTSSGHEMLDKTALASVAKWKFNSYTEGGHTVSHRVRIPVNFKLD